LKPGDLNPTISDAAPAASGPDLTVSDAPRLPILARGPDALLSVIVPVYNEAQVIGDFLGALQQFLGALDLRWEAPTAARRWPWLPHAATRSGWFACRATSARKPR
jgi:hypothetical protein